jgi:DNA-directed RNA polymerase specialized sigma subunit
MGVGKFVVGEEHDKLERKYVLSTEKGVENLLKDRHHLHSRAVERGDMAAVDILIDMESAVELADLTQKQRETVVLLFDHDLEQKTAAKIIGIDTSTLTRNKQAAIKKITRIFNEWNYI